MTAQTHLILLSLSWIGYGLIHSLLASEYVKRLYSNYFTKRFHAYRLLYNLLALVLLAPPLWLMFSYPGEVLWHWPTEVGWVADALALAAVAGFVISGGIYDLGEFLGLKQLQKEAGRSVRAELTAPLRITPLHRFVRHPWYFFGLVILWTREMNAAWLVTVVTLTLYLLIGSRMEEHKLIRSTASNTGNTGNAFRG